MEKRIHDKYFTEEQRLDMKASTYSELRKKEGSLIAGLLLFFIVGFVEFIIGIAMIFWFNKFTIFLAVVGFLFVFITILFYSVIAKDYNKLVERHGGNIKRRGK